MAKVEHTSDARVLVGIDISRHRHEVLIAVPGKTRRRRMTIEKSLLLSDIYETEKVSAGLPVSPGSDVIRMFRMMLAEGRSLIRQRNAIEDRVVELLAERADFQLLRTIPGIGPINALTILAETGDLRRFHHHRQFLKFCGMDLATVQSGMFRGRSKISKYGNPHVRRLIIHCARSCFLHLSRANHALGDWLSASEARNRTDPDPHISIRVCGA